MSTNPEHLLKLLADTQSELDQLKQQVGNLEEFHRRAIADMTTGLMGALAVLAEMLLRTPTLREERDQVIGDLLAFARLVEKERAITAKALRFAAAQIWRIDHPVGEPPQ